MSELKTIRCQIQRTFDFDYGDDFKAGEQESLEKLADVVRDSMVSDRRSMIDKRLNIAASLFNAKKLFRTEKSEARWADWVENRCGVKRSSADLAIQVHRAFGKVNPEKLIGIPPSRIAELAKDKNKLARKEVLKLSEVHFLTETEVDAAIKDHQPAIEGDEVNFKVKTPTTVEDLAEAVDINTNKLLKKIKDTDLREELPSVLRTKADQMDEQFGIVGNDDDSEDEA